MKFRDFFRIITILLAIIAATMCIPLFVAVACKEYDVIMSFVWPMAGSFILFLIFFIPFRKQKINLTVRSTFMVVAGAWIFASLIGSLPLYLSNAIPSFTDAFYESVSGFSTTGATILSDVECLPRSINLWRCQTHWLGGMGIVTLTVALLPLLGVGGFQLIKAETTGPEKGKVTAKITTTAKILWIIYFSFTAIETVLLMIFGMDFIDALSHALSTLGTGGFSTRNASIGAYDSVAIDIVVTAFMFLAGINFSMFFYLFTKKTSEINHNSEFRAYIGIIVVFAVAITLSNLDVYDHRFFKSLRYSLFQLCSVMSTTGFATADFTTWRVPAQFWIFAGFLIGGCSGSTSGGVKVVRWVILFKQFGNEVKRMLHPHGIFTVKLNDKVGRKDIVFNVASFMFLYVILVFITTFVGTLGNLPVFDAFTGALSMVGNVGPGYGSLGPSCNYGFLPGFVKWWYCFAMLAGRLELYTMIIFFLPEYWKK